jgi:acyl-CoA synthetase (AMP-forming)/AMP-acid ligase II
MPGIEHKLIDPDTGVICPPGTEGEICVRGYNLMQRLYQVDPAETFDADGYYHTGDLGIFDADGYLFFRGRLGEIIRSGGTNVVPREVEGALVECAGVSEAFVFGVPDAKLGTVVGAAIVLEPGASLTADELRKQLKNVLSAYKLPRRIEFVAKRDLPMTRTGKVHKARLRERLQAGHT